MEILLGSSPALSESGICLDACSSLAAWGSSGLSDGWSLDDWLLWGLDDWLLWSLDDWLLWSGLLSLFVGLVSGVFGGISGILGCLFSLGGGLLLGLLDVILSLLCQILDRFVGTFG